MTTKEEQVSTSTANESTTTTTNRPGFNPNPADTTEKELSYSLLSRYGDKPRDDYIEVTKKVNGNVVKLRRWTTFKSFHFPNGAIVTGFRGRRDYKDGNCQGLMCCKWCPDQKEFLCVIFTISNGYNGTFSEKDFETIEIVSESDFTLQNSNAVKNIKIKTWIIFIFSKQ